MYTYTNLPLRDEQYGTTCIPKGPCSPEISTVFVRLLHTQNTQQNTIIHFINKSVNPNPCKLTVSCPSDLLCSQALKCRTCLCVSQHSTAQSCFSTLPAETLSMMLAFLTNFQMFHFFSSFSAVNVLGMWLDDIAGV